MNRRSFIQASALTLPVAAAATATTARAEGPDPIVSPKSKRRILLSCKLTMITKTDGEKKLTINDRLKLAADAGFDGVDFDEAGSFTAEQARAAVKETGVFVHNAINHAHWNTRLTDPIA